MADEQMWIAGEWCAAENGATSEALNPATGEVMATVPKATVGDVHRCVASSRDAFEEWTLHSEDAFSTKWLPSPTPRRKNSP